MQSKPLVSETVIFAILAIIFLPLWCWGYFFNGVENTLIKTGVDLRMIFPASFLALSSFKFYQWRREKWLVKLIPLASSVLIGLHLIGVIKLSHRDLMVFPVSLTALMMYLDAGQKTKEGSKT